MAVFTYKAMEQGAGDITGTIAADTPRQARQLLRQRGLVVRDIADAGTSRSWRTIFRFDRTSRRSAIGHRIARRQSTELLRELSTLLAVGMPLTEALETCGAQHRGRFHASILLLRDQVASGASLAGAMQKQPRVFDELCINIAEVGEDAGTLDTSLERLADFRERSEQLRGRVATALIYPAIVTTTAVLCSIFLMTFVVPRILEPLIEQGLPLPFPTRVVKGISDFLVAWWWLILSIAAGAVAAVTALMRSLEMRRRWHGLLLRLPLLGDLIRKQATVHIAIVMATLLRSGIVLVRALQIAQRTTSNLVLREALHRCEATVAAGGDIAEAMRKTDAFGPLVVQVFALGAQSGRLEDMLDRLAESYERQVSTAAARLAAILEPCLIIALALIVLFIV
ncbi:MAG TPA: type II secretion system F family protein, partial [Humisphaera sp.]|nr:type II secretion system F family protein [Humisphaera sp.]